MNVTIVGIGCIGATVGISLSHNTNTRVTFLDRPCPRNTALMKSNHVTLMLPEENNTRERICLDSEKFHVTIDPLQGYKESEVIFIATKRMSNEAVVEDIVKFGKQGATIVLLQNGLEVGEDFMGFLKGRRNDLVVLEAVVVFNAVVDEEGGEAKNVFRWVSSKTSSHVVLDGSTKEKAERAEKIAQVIHASGIDSYAEPLFREVQCGKVLLNIINAPNALAGCDTQMFMLTPEYRAVWGAAVAETRRVFTRAGINVRAPRGESSLQLYALPWLLSAPTPIVRFVVWVRNIKLEGGKSSMAQDLDNFAPDTEIDYIHGRVVAWARKLGMNTPVLDRLIVLVKDATAKRAGSPKMSPEALLAAVGL